MNGSYSDCIKGTKYKRKHFLRKYLYSLKDLLNFVLFVLLKVLTLNFMRMTSIIAIFSETLQEYFFRQLFRQSNKSH